MRVYDRAWTREEARRRAALPEPRIESDIARTSHLAQEAAQTCHQYALALQRALAAMTEG